MKTIPYSVSEIRPGAIIQGDEILTVMHVRWRLRSGVELHTQRLDGHSGPVLYPHPDEKIQVAYMPSLSDDDVDYLRHCRRDYPWATIRP